MDAIRLHSDGTLSSEAPFAGLLRMRLELDGDVTLRSFFRLLKRNPLARELVPGLGDALVEAEACPASGCRYPGLEALRLGKRVELTGFPGTPRVDVYLAVEGVGDELPELRCFRLRDLLVTPKDIDSQVSDMAKVIGYGIGLALHPGLRVEDLDLLLS